MDENQSVPMATSSAELLQAQAELWCHTFGYLKSMALQCAIKLGIPCAVHRSGGAASLPELLAALSLAPSKQPYLSRLMRFLTASGIFTCTHAEGAKAAAAATEAEGVYGLTPVSRLLAGVDQHASLSPFVLSQITNFQVNAALHLAEWFGNKDEPAVAETPFKMVHGADFWAIACRHADFAQVFNDGMGSDSRFLMDLVVRECRQVFKGIGSLIDVGGGNGAAARAIAKAFQHVKCTVLDLPQVVDGMPAAGDIIEFVAGDMMDFIPPADVVLLKHHCRSCGRTLCHEHSSYHIALPQYRIYTDVRVCYDCFNKSSSHGGVSNASSPGGVSSAADSFSGLNLGKDDVSSPTKNLAVQSAAAVECKCGMPLCICEAPKPEPAPVKNISAASSSAQSNPRPKKSTSNQQSAESSAKKASTTSSSNSSSFLNLGLMSNDKGLSEYDVSGEGLREAIKSGDVKGVKKLLSQGVDSNYCDKQGFTLLHLAALFNQTEIALILIDSGANIQSKNGQGETPLDCAPPMLQYKMCQRMEELAASQRPE